MTDPDEDDVNDTKGGTSAHDKLFRLKPFMDTIRLACEMFHPPRRSLAVDERMVAFRGNAMRQCMKEDKSSTSGFKLFVLADSSNAYTTNVSVCRNELPPR